MSVGKTARRPCRRFTPACEQWLTVAFAASTGAVFRILCHFCNAQA